MLADRHEPTRGVNERRDSQRGPHETQAIARPHCDHDPHERQHQRHQTDEEMRLDRIGSTAEIGLSRIQGRLPIGAEGVPIPGADHLRQIPDGDCSGPEIVIGPLLHALTQSHQLPGRRDLDGCQESGRGESGQRKSAQRFGEERLSAGKSRLAKNSRSGT